MERILAIAKKLFLFLLRGIANLFPNESVYDEIAYIDKVPNSKSSTTIKIYFNKVGVHIEQSMKKVYEDQDEKTKKEIDDYISELSVN